MPGYFIIYQASAVEARPPISFKIREYFEEFIGREVLEPKKIIVGGQWKVILVMLFMTKGSKVLFDKMALARGYRTISAERTKMYEVLILTEAIKESEEPLLTTIALMYEAIGLFLTTTFKKVRPEFMKALWEKVDLEYLLSLPYPAATNEQRYVGDEWAN